MEFSGAGYAGVLSFLVILVVLFLPVSWYFLGILSAKLLKEESLRGVFLPFIVGAGGFVIAGILWNAMQSLLKSLQITWKITTPQDFLVAMFIFVIFNLTGSLAIVKIFQIFRNS